MTRIERLLSSSSDPLTRMPPGKTELLMDYPLGPELLRMLEHKNGFYAFESALHVFPVTSDPVDSFNLAEWNSPSMWRDEYADFATGLLFFAEDIFQDQFCLAKSGVLRFQAETGGTKPMAHSIEEWADVLLRDYALETGWALANQWQAANGPLPPRKRLAPKKPFFLGGEYALENLWACDAVEGMRFKGDLAVQTRNLRDGTQVQMIMSKKPTN